MDSAKGREQAAPNLSRRDFLKSGATAVAALSLRLAPEKGPLPPKEQYTEAEWFAIRSLPERAVDTVVSQGFAGIGLPVIKRHIAVIEGERHPKGSPLERVFPTYSLMEVRRVLGQLNSSILYDVTFFFLPQWDPAYVLPISRQRVDIDPETGAERPNSATTQWHNLYIPGKEIRLGRGLLGESWRVETTEELPPGRKLEITWVGKRTPFEIDARGKLVFDPTRSITFYSELKQDNQGGYFEMFSGVSPTGVLYFPIEMSVALEPQPIRPRQSNEVEI